MSIIGPHVNGRTDREAVPRYPPMRGGPALCAQQDLEAFTPPPRSNAWSNDAYDNLSASAPWSKLSYHRTELSGAPESSLNAVVSHVPGYAHWRDPARERRGFLSRAGATLLSLLPIPMAGAQGKIYRIGYLNPRASRDAVDDAFLRGMEEHGYTVGRNLAIEYRWAGNDLGRLPPLAEELVRLRVDVIVTATTAGTRAAMAATSTIPIVFAAAADPVAAGFVASLGRPGGDVTGVSLQTTDAAGKRVQILHEVVAGGAPMGLLVERFTTPTQGTTGILVAETLAAGKQLAVQIVVRARLPRPTSWPMLSDITDASR